MKIGIYPGSFDPITYGHIDIIERASKVVDKLIVSVLINKNKNALFSIDERVDMIKECVKQYKNVEVAKFDGLLVDFAKEKQATIIIRGLRAVTDFEYELELAQTNRQLCDDIDTIFFYTNIKYSYLSSSAVREIASYGGDISKFVPPMVETMIKNKYKNIVAEV